MKECGRNAEVMFLLNGLRPDFRTIGDFRKRNANAIRKVFHTFMKACNDLNGNPAGLLREHGRDDRGTGTCGR